MITHINEGFDFLGWNVRKYKGKLLIKPAKKKTTAFLNRVRETIKYNKAAAQVNLIRMLNPMIRGWAQYHCKCCAKQTFSWVDNQIWNCLWRWAKRRHPKRKKKWIKNRYFHSIGNRNWAFSVKEEPKSGKVEIPQLDLCLAASTIIRRHTKVKADMNPFDPKWREYHEIRKNRGHTTEDENLELFA